MTSTTGTGEDGDVAAKEPIGIKLARSRTDSNKRADSIVVTTKPNRPVDTAYWQSRTIRKLIPHPSDARDFDGQA